MISNKKIINLISDMKDYSLNKLTKSLLDYNPYDNHYYTGYYEALEDLSYKLGINEEWR